MQEVYSKTSSMCNSYREFELDTIILAAESFGKIVDRNLVITFSSMHLYHGDKDFL